MLEERTTLLSLCISLAWSGDNMTFRCETWLGSTANLPDCVRSEPLPPSMRELTYLGLRFM